MTDRRQIKVSDSFFERLDALFGSERTAQGEPSATDFLVVELPTVIERFARDFDGLPMLIDGVPNARVRSSLVGWFQCSPCLGSSCPVMSSNS